jgi:hypothetical protein
MKDLEKKGAVFLGEEASPDNKKVTKRKFLPKVMNQSSVQLSEKLKDILFNKRDEGYYFRKFHREKSLEVK